MLFAKVRPKQPSEEWVSSLWDYICTSGDNTRGSNGSLGNNGGRARRDDQNNNASETLQLFEGAWPLLPATGGVGSDEIRVLLQLRQQMPVVSPLTDGMGARARQMGAEVKKVTFFCCKLKKVRYLDLWTLMSFVRNSYHQAV